MQSLVGSLSFLLFSSTSLIGLINVFRKEKIRFSYPIISITAEGARSRSQWKKAWDGGFILCVTLTTTRTRQQCGSLACPLTIFVAKDRNPSTFSYAEKGLSKQPACCPQSKSTHNVKYCMHSFFWFPFSFSSPPRFCKVTLKPTSAVEGICPRAIFYPE